MTLTGRFYWSRWWTDPSVNGVAWFVDYLGYFKFWNHRLFLDAWWGIVNVLSIMVIFNPIIFMIIHLNLSFFLTNWIRYLLNMFSWTALIVILSLCGLLLELIVNCGHVFCFGLFWSIVVVFWSSKLDAVKVVV